MELLLMNDFSKLDRLLAGLDAADVKKYGRNIRVAEKTGYSPSMVAKVLSGHVALTDRFIQAVCSAFYINKEWVLEGDGPINDLETKNKDSERARLYVERLRDLLKNDIKVKFGPEDHEGILEKELGRALEIIQSMEKHRDLVNIFTKIPLEEMESAINALVTLKHIAAKTEASKLNQQKPTPK